MKPLFQPMIRSKLVLLAACSALLLTACGTTPKSGPGKTSGGGGYYKDDGPGANPPADIDQIPDALPQVEPLASGANKPYVIFGKRYVPDTTQQPYRARGVASWYGRKFHGARTSNGEIYDMYGMTAAHTTLPIPSYARVTRVATGKSVLVRVNDRGPFHDDRLIDLSYTAAHKLGIIGPGRGEVVVERLMPEEIARIRAERSDTNKLAGVAPSPASVAALGNPDNAVASTLPVSDVPRNTPPQELAPLPVQVPSTATAPVSLAAASGVFLQVGAFSGQRNAEDLLARLRSQIPDWTEPVRLVNTDHLHRVHIGPYANRESALQAAQRLQTRIDIAPVIVVR